MMVTVRQLENTREINSTFDDDKRLEIAKDAFIHNQYLEVVSFEINMDEGDFKEVLNIAYEVTNSITCAWYENPNMNVSDYAKDGCRSTSVGDLIQVNGKSYMVAGMGFREVIKD